MGPARHLFTTRTTFGTLIFDAGLHALRPGPGDTNQADRGNATVQPFVKNTMSPASPVSLYGPPLSSRPTPLRGLASFKR